jgi:hypothetical protein
MLSIPNMHSPWHDLPTFYSTLYFKRNFKKITRKLLFSWVAKFEKFERFERDVKRSGSRVFPNIRNGTFLLLQLIAYSRNLWEICYDVFQKTFFLTFGYNADP